MASMPMPTTLAEAPLVSTVVSARSDAPMLFATACGARMTHVAPVTELSVVVLKWSGWTWVIRIKLARGKTVVACRGPHRVVVDRRPVPTHHETRVVDRMNHHVAVLSGEVVAGECARPVQLRRPIKPLAQIRRGGIGVLVHASALERQQPVPLWKVRGGVDAVVEARG